MQAALGLHIVRFPEALEAALADLKPNLIADYAFNLAGAYNSFYAECQACPLLSMGLPLQGAVYMLPIAEVQGALLHKVACDITAQHYWNGGPLVNQYQCLLYVMLCCRLSLRNKPHTQFNSNI